MNIFFYDVAISVPLRQCFTYSSNLKIEKGSRVLVPFGNRKVVGLVIKKSKAAIGNNIEIKKIISSIDTYPVFNKSIFNTILWSSEYYHHPIGEVFNTFIPNQLRKANNKVIEPLAVEESYQIPINEEEKRFDLTPDQSKALKQLIKLNSFQPSLLYGVTGSGKTEVYLRLVENCIKDGKSALILVPEINLTPQLFNRFTSRFNGEIGLYHSRQTPAQRLKVWLKARFGNIKIVIGTRSAVLMPMKNIGLIVIDEEHDQSYRQSEGFKFSARDIGIKRAQEENIPIVLGSATPSLQTLRLVEEKKYKKIDMLTRVDGKNPPKLVAMDINDTPLIGGIASETLNIIERTLNKKEQVLIFINRRGFAPIFQCESCGWVANCKSCDSNLVYHQERNRLICHRCESAYKVNESCPSCKSTNFQMYGTGTEQV